MSYKYKLDSFFSLIDHRNVNIYDPVYLDPLILQFQYGHCPKKQFVLGYGPYTPLYVPIHLQAPNLALDYRKPIGIFMIGYIRTPPQFPKFNMATVRKNT